MQDPQLGDALKNMLLKYKASEVENAVQSKITEIVTNKKWSSQFGFKKSEKEEDKN